MGYLLKETLKCLCGVNQWAYAVFWKLGFQNPNLLIWEDCYYETTLDSMQMCVARIINEESGVHNGNKVSVLINRMMTRNPINIVGEGMVGRAAFTGKHQWIFSENYLGDDHPPEVLNEARHQYSAGMQTVAVIPVHPHGVVQLGSYLVIDENVGFVEDVKSLIQQLGCVPDALLSENYMTDESAQSIGIPTSLGACVSEDHSRNIKMTNSTSSISNSCNQQSILTNSLRLVGESSDSLKRIVPISPLVTPTFQTHKPPQHLARPHDIHCQSEVIPAIKPSAVIKSNVENDFKRSFTIPPNLQTWMKLNTASYSSAFGFNHENGVGQSGTCSNIRLKDEHTLSDSNFQNHVNSNGSSSDSFLKPHRTMTQGLNTSAHKNLVSTQLFGRSESGNSTGSHQKPNSVLKSLSNLNRPADISLSHMAGFGHQNFDSFTTDYVPISEMEDPQVRHLRNDSQTLIMEARPENGFSQALSLPDEHMTLGDVIPEFLHGFLEHKTENESLRSKNVFVGDFHPQQPSGNDLFDILGVDYRNKLASCNQNSFIDACYIDNQNAGKCSSTGIFQPGHRINSVIGDISEGNVVSGMGSEHLLDAVISKAHLASNQSISDHVSCRETLTKNSGGAAPSFSTFNGACISNQIAGEFFSRPKTLDKAGMGEGSSSLRSGRLEEDAQNCSQTSSFYDSQISSWLERGNNLKQETSVSTAYSKRPDEINKSNRKRLKPGENPRPRPKDRQMIQDRVKELREIVPNGAKCSIDALLERTIKHMVFLQSVTKHADKLADKLKQTGESQIIRKENGLLLKDNFEGGATWAFEVGSQSMVCPIIVEDLHSPRQMLVEMLCEERGFFLEIADFVRGLGLTILKGVIEARKGKIWAHFAVEANRDVTRMEIFISLVGLLEQTSKSSGGPVVNAISSDNMMVNQSFHQAPCIPATNRPHSLQ